MCYGSDANDVRMAVLSEYTAPLDAKGSGYARQLFAAGIAVADRPTTGTDIF